MINGGGALLDGYATRAELSSVDPDPLEVPHGLVAAVRHRAPDRGDRDRWFHRRRHRRGRLGATPQPCGRSRPTAASTPAVTHRRHAAVRRAGTRASDYRGRVAAFTVLFCADPLSPHRVDPYFAGQAALVRDLGGAIALVDHDAILAGNAIAATRRVPADLGPVWYRGWMIPADRYAELAAVLAAHGTPLRVEPDDYRAAHELPGWYATFAAVTPATVWTPRKPFDPLPADEVADLVQPLGDGPGIVKDYVKSRKHEWTEACFLPDLADAGHAARVIARLIELQEDTLQGGIVVRRFEDFGRAAGRTAEARVWWVDAEPALVSAHPDTPEQAPRPDLRAITPLVAALGGRFVTTDMALRADGEWRVVEVGDGQVSDLPPTADAALLFSALAR
ncbi:MAG: ATP-grasp domain-containing protein [Hamadaea sp.]|nr:ATP-grasp domain-containing protein [Hamadaea sp.]